MTQELSKNLFCVLLKGGMRIWIEENQLINLKKLLVSQNKDTFVEIDKEFVCLAEISGIFTPAMILELDRLKRGQWKCEYNIWHNRNDICYCGRR